MIGYVGRAVRLALAVALVSGVVGLGATSAQAFIDETLVCADPNELLGNFNDEENWVEFENGNCKKLCKKYSQECKSYIKKNELCARNAVSDNATFDVKAICDPLTDKSAKKNCKSDVKSDKEAAKKAIKNAANSFTQDCEDLQSDCVEVCENGLPVLN